MYDFLDNAKMTNYIKKAKEYLKLKQELGIMGSVSLNVDVEQIKKLSQGYGVKTIIMYWDGLTHPYVYSLTIDGVNFLGSNDLQKAKEFGFTEDDFKRGAEVWG